MVVCGALNAAGSSPPWASVAVPPSRPFVAPSSAAPAAQRLLPSPASLPRPQVFFSGRAACVGAAAVASRCGLVARRAAKSSKGGRPRGRQQSGNPKPKISTEEARARFIARQDEFVPGTKVPQPPAPRVFAISEQPGATPPLGFFDPAGFCDRKNEEEFKRIREAETKHGRIAMLAAVGAVAQHYIKLPFGGFDKAPSGAIAAALAPPGEDGLKVLLVLCALWEIAFSLPILTVTRPPSMWPKDVPDPLGTPEEQESKELNNGRFAMVAVLGILAAEAATGKDAVQQLGL